MSNINKTKKVFTGSGSGSTSLTTSAGTYLPVGASPSNITTITPSVAQYIRVGSVVTVSGFITVNFTDPDVGSSCTLTLPIVTTFTGGFQAAGTAIRSTIVSTPQQAYIQASIGTSLVSFRCLPAADSGAMGFDYIYTYLVV